MKHPFGEPCPTFGWKKGPLPPNTWFWGGVVLVGDNLSGGFYFADFCGDHVLLPPVGKDDFTRYVKPEEVLWYNNGLGEAPLEV